MSKVSVFYSESAYLLAFTQQFYVGVIELLVVPQVLVMAVFSRVLFDLMSFHDLRFRLLDYCYLQVKLLRFNNFSAVHLKELDQSTLG